MVLSYLTVAQTKWRLRVDEGHSGFKTMLMSAMLLPNEIKRAFYLFERSWTGELAQLVNWLSSDSLYPRKKIECGCDHLQTQQWRNKERYNLVFANKVPVLSERCCLKNQSRWHMWEGEMITEVDLWIAHAFAHNCMCTQTYLYMHMHGRCVNKHLNKEIIRNNEGKKWERRKENRIISPIFLLSSHHCLCMLYCYQLRQFCFHVCNGAGTNYLAFSKSTSGCMSTAC